MLAENNKSGLFYQKSFLDFLFTTGGMVWLADFRNLCDPATRPRVFFHLPKPASTARRPALFLDNPYPPARAVM